MPAGDQAARRAGGSGFSRLAAEAFVQKPTEAGWCPFALGQPDADLLPRQLVADATARVAGELARASPFVLQYGRPQGPAPFTQAVAARLLGGRVPAGRVALSAGNSAALGVVAGALRAMNEAAFPDLPGARDALCELPTYFLAQGILEDAGCHVSGVPRLPSCGSPVAAIRAWLESRRDQGLAPPALLYLIPFFHNPCGVSYSHAELLELVGLAEQFQTHIIFDEPYNDLAFDGDRPPPVACVLQDSSRVLSLVSFSKILAPGLRTGFVVAQEDTLFRLYTDSGTIRSGGGANPLGALVVADLIESGELSAHAGTTASTLGERMRVLFEALAAEGLADSQSAPKGGYFAWVDLGIDTSNPAFLNECKASKLSVTPGAACMISGASAVDSAQVALAAAAASRHVRLCVAHTSPDVIRRGVTLLAQIVRRLR